MKIEGHFGAEALRILRDVPGVTVETARAARGGGRGDAVLRYGPAAEAVAVEVKRRANAATAWQIVQQSRAAPDGNLLLVAGATTADAREILERHGVAVVDGLGNAHVELPGFVLHTEAQRGRRADTPRPATHTRRGCGPVPDLTRRPHDRSLLPQQNAGVVHDELREEE